MTEQQLHNLADGIFPAFEKCMKVMQDEKLCFEQCIMLGMGLSGVLLSKSVKDFELSNDVRGMCQVVASALIHAGPHVISGVLTILAIDLPKQFGSVRATNEAEQVLSDVIKRRL